MTTPPILDDESQSLGPRQGVPYEEPQAGGAAVWVLRLASTLVIPAVVIIFFFAFGFLKNEDGNKAIQVLVAIVVGIGGVWALYWGMDRLVTMLPERVGSSVRPFVFVGPAMVIIAFYLVYPAVNTTILSFQDERSREFVGFDNFARIFTESEYLISIRNSLVWVIVVPFLAVAIGLAFAWF